MTRFSRIFIVALATLAVAIGGLTAEAQRRGGGQRGGPGMGGRPGGGSPLFLLMNPQVGEELKLTEEQSAQIREIMREGMGGDRRGPRPGGEELSEAEREKARQEARERGEKLLKQVAEKVLKTEQATRLREIMMWVQGPSVLASPNVVQALGITDTQKERIDAVLKETAAKTEAAMQKMRDSRTEDQDFRAMFQKFGQIREKLQSEAKGKLMPILSSEQLATFKEMMGEKFVLESRMPQGRGRGPGDRGQRPGDRGGDRPRRDARPQT